jgi:hypothetical protein
VARNCIGSIRAANGTPAIPVTRWKLLTTEAITIPAYELVRPTTWTTSRLRSREPRARKPAMAKAYVPMAVSVNGQSFRRSKNESSAADAQAIVTSAK